MDSGDADAGASVPPPRAVSEATSFELNGLYALLQGSAAIGSGIGVSREGPSFPVWRTAATAAASETPNSGENSAAAAVVVDAAASWRLSVPSLDEPQAAPIPVVQIAYTGEVEYTLSHFRGLAALGENDGPRFLALTAFLLRHCAAHYTAWKRRRDVVCSAARFLSSAGTLWGLSGTLPPAHAEEGAAVLAAWCPRWEREALTVPLKRGEAPAAATETDSGAAAAAAAAPANSGRFAAVCGSGSGPSSTAVALLSGGLGASLRVWLFCPWRAVAWELERTSFYCLRFQKNFQVWSHRRELLLAAGARRSFACAAAFRSGAGPRIAAAVAAAAAAAASAASAAATARSAALAAEAALRGDGSDGSDDADTGTGGGPCTFFDALRWSAASPESGAPLPPPSPSDGPNVGADAQRCCARCGAAAGNGCVTAAAFDERELCSAAIADDAKNYHAWAHRAWFVQWVPALAGTTGTKALLDAEAAYTAALLRQDVFNNSAWCHRMHVVRLALGLPVGDGALASDDASRAGATNAPDAEAAPQEEAAADARIAAERGFALGWAAAEPDNECPFSYLAGLCRVDAAVRRRRQWQQQQQQHQRQDGSTATRRDDGARGASDGAPSRWPLETQRFALDIAARIESGDIAAAVARPSAADAARDAALASGESPSTAAAAAAAFPTTRRSYRGHHADGAVVALCEALLAANATNAANAASGVDVADVRRRGLAAVARLVEGDPIRHKYWLAVAAGFAGGEGAARVD